MKNKSNASKLFSNKRFNIFLSLFLAILTWFVVSLYIEPESTSVVYNVPVDFEYNSATYESQGLEILNMPQITVNIEVKGDGYLVYGLKPEDFSVYPLYTNVRGAGVYNLTLDRKSRSSTKKFEIIGVTPGTVTVQFDKVTDKKMPISVNATDIATESGYFMDQPIPAPAEVTLHGPETSLNKVAKVVANVSLAQKSKESAILTSPLELHDKDGNVLSASELHINMDVEQVEVQINILEERSIPLSVEYTNVPSGFDTKILKMKLSHDTLRVAAQAAKWETMPSFNVGYIDLAQFELDAEYSLPIKLPDDFKNMDNLNSVTVTFDTSGLSEKVVNVTDIRGSGATPKGLALSVPKNARINNVVLIGPAQELDLITATGVIAEINAPELSHINGQQNVPVKIVVPGSSKVFATGVYTVLCNTKIE